MNDNNAVQDYMCAQDKDKQYPKQIQTRSLDADNNRGTMLLYVGCLFTKQNYIQHIHVPYLDRMK